MDGWMDGWMDGALRRTAHHSTAQHTLVAADGVAAGTASGGGGGRGRCPLSEGSSAPASPVRDHERARTNKRKLVKSPSRSGWMDGFRAPWISHDIWLGLKRARYYVLVAIGAGPVNAGRTPTRHGTVTVRPWYGCCGCGTPGNYIT